MINGQNQALRKVKWLAYYRIQITKDLAQFGRVPALENMWIT